MSGHSVSSCCERRTMPTWPSSASVTSRSSYPTLGASSGGGSHRRRSPLRVTAIARLPARRSRPVTARSSAPPRRRARTTRARARSRDSNAASASTAGAVVAAHELARSRRLNASSVVEARREAVLDQRSRRRVDLRLVLRVLAPPEPQENLASVPVAVVAVARSAPARCARRPWRTSARPRRSGRREASGGASVGGRAAAPSGRSGGERAR